MIKATVGGIPVEIWFTPSFNIKTTSKELEQELRRATLRAYNPWSGSMETVRVTKGLQEAYTFLVQLNEEIPQLKITFSEAPELPAMPIGETEKGLLF